MNSKHHDTDPCFTSFKTDVSAIQLPANFTFPFQYSPHELALCASTELQDLIQNQNDWDHNFGLSESKSGSGKMFGVLVVKNSNGELGYLSAFSGNLAGKSQLPHFVPPVFDTLEKEGFFKIGETELNLINRRISEIETSELFQETKSQYEAEKQNKDTTIEEGKRFLKQQKKARKAVREEAKQTASDSEMNALLEQLSKESQMEKIKLKHQTIELEAKVEKAQQTLSPFLEELQQLRSERKNKSARLQQQIFDQYQFLDANSEVKSLCSIFSTNEGATPPAGAGDCAAPKLLQYAYTKGYTPVVMAEFWWGVSPKTEVRHHAHFYPSCRGKCEPILGHMLRGLQVDPNPLIVPSEEDKTIEILYDDEWIAAINKPADLLSVPGKSDLPSAYDQLIELYPNSEGPLLVHRLDMATSGILLIAKDLETHQKLQKQFMDRTIKKRYIALLDGILPQNDGIIDLPLRHNIDDRPRQLVCFEHGKRAITRWEKIEESQGKTRVYFYPVTGRSHQLRVHAAFVDGLNTPIVGDNLYGTNANRLHLHAERLTFRHPVTGQNKTIIAKAPF